MKRLMRIFCFIGLAGMALVGCQTGGGGASMDTTLDAGATKFTTAANLDLRYFKMGKIFVKRKIYKQLKSDMFQLKRILENGKRL